MSTVVTEKSAKQGVLEMIQKMPDDATLSDIFDAVRLRHAIDEARREIDAGLGIPHEEIERTFAKWLA